MNQPPIQEERSPHFVMEVAATAVFWGLWAYFIAPLVSLLLWAGGVHVFVEEMITLGGYEVLLAKLTTYGLVILGIVVIVNAWVLWNVRRYGDHNTRTHELAAVTLVESADFGGLPARQLERLQQAKRVVVAFNEENKLRLQGEEEGATPVRQRGGVPV